MPASSPAGGKGDVIVSDELNHGSIIDGVRLSYADREVYRHGDAEDLAKKLDEVEKHVPTYRRMLIITDGVFSMDGDIAPLDKIGNWPPSMGRCFTWTMPTAKGSWEREGEGSSPLSPHARTGACRDGHFLQGVRRGRRAHLRLGGPGPVRPQ